MTDTPSDLRTLAAGILELASKATPGSAHRHDNRDYAEVQKEDVWQAMVSSGNDADYLVAVSDPATITLLAQAVLSPGGAMADGYESGWVIEHGASEVSYPRYWGGVHGWTHDNLKAVRFSREADARSVAEHMDDGVPDNYRIAEHGWGP